jgi:hypothetical protein
LFRIDGVIQHHELKIQLVCGCRDFSFSFLRMNVVNVIWMERSQEVLVMLFVVSLLGFVPPPIFRIHEPPSYANLSFFLMFLRKLLYYHYRCTADHGHSEEDHSHADKHEKEEGHAHDHSHSAGDEKCKDDTCTDEGHSHGHDHSHNKEKKEEPVAKCEDDTCTHEGHSHGHDHSHNKEKKEEHDHGAHDHSDKHKEEKSHDHGHSHDHGSSKEEKKEIPAWKKRAMESGASDPTAAPFGGNWNMESSLSASGKDKMEE